MTTKKIVKLTDAKITATLRKNLNAKNKVLLDDKEIFIMFKTALNQGKTKKEVEILINNLVSDNRNFFAVAYKKLLNSAFIMFNKKIIVHYEKLDIDNIMSYISLLNGKEVNVTKNINNRISRLGNKKVNQAVYNNLVSDKIAEIKAEIQAKNQVQYTVSNAVMDKLETLTKDDKIILIQTLLKGLDDKNLIFVDKLAKEKLAKEKAEKAKLAKEKKEKLAKEKAEKAKLAKEKKEKLAKEKAEKAEKAKLAKEKKAKEIADKKLAIKYEKTA